MASWTAVTYSNDNIFDYMELTDEYAIYETPVPASWQGRTVVELEVRKKYDINVLATKKNGKLFPLSGAEHAFTADETLLLLGSRKNMQKFLKL